MELRSYLYWNAATSSKVLQHLYIIRQRRQVCTKENAKYYTEATEKGEGAKSLFCYYSFNMTSV